MKHFVAAILALSCWFLHLPSGVQAAVNCSAAGVICISGTLPGDQTWTPANIYVISNASLTIPSGVTLTIQAGTIVKFDSGRSLVVNGTLNVTGDSTSRVYFTSIRDDTLGGDTDNDTSVPAAGIWGSIRVKSGGIASLSYMEARYGGHSNGGDTTVYTETGTTVTLDHLVVKNSEGCAISSDPAYEPILTGIVSTDFTGSDINGLCMRGGTLTANATWDETEVAYVVQSDMIIPVGLRIDLQPGIVVKMWNASTEMIVDGTLNANGTSGSPVYMTSLRDDSLAGLTNKDNNAPAAGNWAAITVRSGGTATLAYLEARYGGYWDSRNSTVYTDVLTTVTLDHLVVKNSEGCAISSDPAYEPILTGIVSTDFTGSDINGLCMRGGTLTANATWDETELAHVVNSDLTIPEGLTLNWQSGIVIKPRNGETDVIVDGQLNINGTSGSKVYITSIRDDTLGGATNNNNDAPVTGNWRRIYFRSGSTGTLNYASFRYGGNAGDNHAAVHIESASPKIEYCEFTLNARGVSVTGASAHPSIHNSSIFANTEYGVFNATANNWIDAKNNWWGSATGPYDPPGTDGDYNSAGKGDRVSDYVLYRPWLRIGFDFSIFLSLLIK